MRAKSKKHRRDTLLDRADLMARHAATAIQKSIRDAASAGADIVFARQGKIVKRAPDGTETIIGKIATGSSSRS